jgi:hypothetical protein
VDTAERLTNGGPSSWQSNAATTICLFPQHGPGRKHERPIVLAGWQQSITRRHPKQLIRGLIDSDGCRSGTSRSPIGESVALLDSFVGPKS